MIPIIDRPDIVPRTPHPYTMYPQGHAPAHHIEEPRAPHFTPATGRSKQRDAAGLSNSYGSGFAGEDIGEGRPIDHRGLAAVLRHQNHQRSEGSPGRAAPLAIAHIDFSGLRETMPATMESIRHQALERYPAGMSELRAEPIRTTELKRPFVDNSGLQHYNPSLYHQHQGMRYAPSASPAGVTGEGAPLRLPTGHHADPRYGYAQPHGMPSTDPRVSTPHTPRRNNHHAFGKPENVPRDIAGMSPYDADFSWSTAEEVKMDNLHSYLQSTLVPQDDRVFPPTSAAARGYRGGGGRPADTHAAGPQRGGSSRSPPRFRLKGSPPRDQSPSRAIGLNYPIDPSMQEKYGYRGWSHLMKREPMVR